MDESDRDCFILSRHWRDTRQGLELVFWGVSQDGPVRLVVTDQQPVCFVERSQALPVPANVRRAALELRSLDNNAPVDALYFASQRELADTRERVRAGGGRLLESDLKPSDRFLMERFIRAAGTVRGDWRSRDGFSEVLNPRLKPSGFRPALRLMSVDIESDGLAGALFSIAASSGDVERVFMVGTSEEVKARATRTGARADVTAPGADIAVQACADEATLLSAFFRWLTVQDPDVLVGWNVVNFDLDFLDRRSRELGVAFALGRGGERCAVLQPQSAAGVRVARIPGRVVLDGIDLLRAAFWSFENFELETVAQAILGRGKRIAAQYDRVGEIRHLFATDKSALAAYNLEDCRLVLEIFAHAQLLGFAVRRAELTGLAVDRLGGLVAAFDNLYLPRLHRKGKVAPDVGDSPRGGPSPGGYVLDSSPGLYHNVLVLDFKSLYPSIIRTYRIDPFGLSEPGVEPVPGFNEAEFSRFDSILPKIIEDLWAVRDEAKRVQDGPLSQAVKILMNSFYGVLGAHGCRFFDPRLASSITRRGHQIIRDTRDWLIGQEFDVIYGDTDSLFVLLGPGPDDAGAWATGQDLAQRLNCWWSERMERELQLVSYLEIEFETVYRRFLMPTVRGEQTGSKKRYAGLVDTPDGRSSVVFKGLESVRTDWTPLARQFQRELYTRIFKDQPFEDYVQQIRDQLYAGHLDRDLIYRKRLRRRLDEYTSNVPPHVQAARQLAQPSRWVNYVITAGGPVPVEPGRPEPRPDYDHYLERQLAPAADGILQFLGTSFDDLTNAQLRIF